MAEREDGRPSMESRAARWGGLLAARCRSPGKYVCSKAHLGGPVEVRCKGGVIDLELEAT
jgi:hypothetical protein